MKKKICIVIAFIIMGLGYFNNKALFSSTKIDYFNEIIKVSAGKVSEFGIKATFESDEDKEAYCLELLKRLQFDRGEVNVVKDDKFYSVEFNDNVYKGYIESAAYDNHNVVTINLVQFDSENRLSELKEKIRNAVGKTEKDINFFDYLKAQINYSDKAKVNREIIGLLKEHKASNIDTIEIDNGFSTVAYTKEYPIIKNNGKWVDLNYAVCSYSSGDYVIIGTPVIITTY